MDRWNRQYEFSAIFEDESVQVTIKPPFRISFEVTKSVGSGLNKASIKIYNLSQTNINRLKKDEKDSKKIYIELKAGYSKIETIFKGDVASGICEDIGADKAINLEAQDGLYASRSTFTCKTVKGDLTEHIINDFKDAKKGKITEQTTLARPQVLVGNSMKLLEENLASGDNLYIENGVINITKPNEVTSSYIPVVSAVTGLLQSPKKAEKEIVFKTLLNPELRIGCLLELKSIYEEKLNGIYKVNTIKYSCDYEGQEWEQEVYCIANSDYKVL